VTPDGLITAVAKFSILNEMIKIFCQTLRCSYSFLACRWDLARLLQKKIARYPLKENKKILYIDATVWMTPKSGGCVGHICGVANALLQHEYQVDYAAEGFLQSLDTKINFIKVAMPKLFIYPPEFNRFHLTRKMTRQLQKYQNNHYQFIYQRMSVENYTGVKLSRIFNIPLVLEFNSPLLWITDHWGDQLHKLKFKKIAHQIEQTCFNLAHIIVTISEAAKAILLESGIPEAKIVCYPNCIDPFLFNPARFSSEQNLQLRQQLGIPESALVLTFIGTFGQWHGVDTIATTIRKLVDHYGQYMNQHQVYFLLIGNGAQMPLVTSLLSEPQYKKRVVFTGLISQELAPAYLAASDIYLSPHLPNPDGSRFFGSPTKLFEYMAMAKPIIASNLEQIGQVLQNSLHSTHLDASVDQEINGKALAILHQPGNIEQMIKAILFLIDNPQWRTVLGNNAREEALKKYTWFHHTAAILEKINQSCAHYGKEKYGYFNNLWNQT
ncbi:MAG: glycosyltransferase family 4 protein, partial [Proteobacteria bacterium]|nr:glycosyltransferase family 4 protein [Pseudomonadota bacterium]